MKLFKNKKLLSLGLIIFCLFILNIPTLFVLAASNYQLLEPSIIIDNNNPVGTGETQPTTYGLKEYISTAYLMGFVLVITFAIVWFIIGGLEYIATDLPGSKKSAKSKILKAFAGILIALSSVLVLQLINPLLLEPKFFQSILGTATK